MYYIIAVDLANKEVCNIILHSLFCSIPTFEFHNITMSCKTTLTCNFFYMPHLLEELEPYQYALVLSPSLSLLFTISNLLKSSDGFENSLNSPSEYVSIQNSTFFKTQILFLDDKVCAISEVKNLAYIKKYASTLTFFLHDF